MNTLRPFFSLLGRASVFWLGLFNLIWLSIVTVGFADPEARQLLSVDNILFAALGFPVAAGWLFGMVIQEFEHTSFATFLPGVRSRLLSGFVMAGLLVTSVTVFLISVNSESQNLPLLFVMGLGAYCAAGVLLDPLSDWRTGVNVIVLLLLVVRSQDVGRLANAHPWMAGLVALAVAALELHRLFARSTFRRKPFRLTKPIPGHFSLEKGQRYESRKRLADRRKAKGWRAGYLGRDPRAWVRAAVHESRGALGWKGLLKTISKLWGLGLLVLLHAWIDKGELSYGQALARSIYDTLFRSPHVEPFGEKGGLYALVWIIIAALGVVTALFGPVALGQLAYPLSRRLRAKIAFRGGLFDAAMLLFILGPVLFGIGHALGLIAGYEVRFDFMPYYFRVLMVTVILMPLGHLGRFRLLEANRRKAENTLVAVVFGIVGFVLAVGAGVFILPLIFVSPILELVTLVAALLVSQWLYRARLIDYYRTADLA